MKVDDMFLVQNEE